MSKQDNPDLPKSHTSNALHAGAVLLVSAKDNLETRSASNEEGWVIEQIFERVSTFKIESLYPNSIK